MSETIDGVIEFWFGAATRTADIRARKERYWWAKDAEFDALVRERFEDTTRRVAAGELDPWRDSARGLLASIIALDQFPRNMYRDSPRAFAHDPLARTLVAALVDSGRDRELAPMHRVFAYLPFEHAENMPDQDRSVRLFEALARECGGEDAETFRNTLEFAHKHRDIIERFGRFPHRNQILGRPSSEEELAFLETPGSSF